MDNNKLRSQVVEFIEKENIGQDLEKIYNKIDHLINKHSVTDTIPPHLPFTLEGMLLRLHNSLAGILGTIELMSKDDPASFINAKIKEKWSE